MLNFIFDFLFPPACPICGGSVSGNGQICIDCWKKFNWITDPCCKKCGYPFPADIEHNGNLLCPDCAVKKHKFDWMRSACAYDDASRNVILPFKHAGKLEFGQAIARAMISQISRENIPKDIIIMPVPLANRRLRSRGYNQAGILARPIAKYLAAPIDFDSVIRIWRPDMGHKSAIQRKRNISGAFKVTAHEKIRGKNILLTDDVFTTGATFNELAKVLKKSGAKWVGGVTFCRVVRAL